MKSSYHLPVLLEESINGLKVYPKGVYVDATFGGGGHSYEILKNLSNEGSLISFDQDPDSFNIVSRGGGGGRGKSINESPGAAVGLGNGGSAGVMVGTSINHVSRISSGPPTMFS